MPMPCQLPLPKPCLTWLYSVPMSAILFVALDCTIASLLDRSNWALQALGVPAIDRAPSTDVLRSGGPELGAMANVPPSIARPAARTLFTVSVPAPAFVRFFPVAVSAPMIDKLLAAGETLTTVLSASVTGALIV